MHGTHWCHVVCTFMLAVIYFVLSQVSPYSSQQPYGGQDAYAEEEDPDYPAEQQQMVGGPGTYPVTSPRCTHSSDWYAPYCTADGCHEHFLCQEPETAAPVHGARAGSGSPGQEDPYEAQYEEHPYQVCCRMPMVCRGMIRHTCHVWNVILTARLLILSPLCYSLTGWSCNTRVRLRQDCSTRQCPPRRTGQTSAARCCMRHLASHAQLVWSVCCIAAMLLSSRVMFQQVSACSFSPAYYIALFTSGFMCLLHFQGLHPIRAQQHRVVCTRRRTKHLVWAVLFLHPS